VLAHQPLLDIAMDLCANLAAEDRYRRLATAVGRVVPCDATAVLRLEGGVLVPVAATGLVPETMGRRFIPAEHPRLERILRAGGPVRLSGSALPDPFDGLLAQGGDALSRVHACMGAPLVVEGRVVGVLTVDALDPAAFDQVDDAELATFAGLAGAAMRTAGLIEAIEEAASRQGLVARQLQRDAAREGGELVGDSSTMRQLRAEIEMVASSDLSVLITGETGVGKELVATAIHRASKRREQPLIRVNCAALPESIAESELFGHARGAFTGAAGVRAGKFEIADGGTLLLDEVGELPLTLQPKLLRVLQSGEVQRVGSDRPHHVDVRILAATNRDLAAEVRAGRFRADLYHRLSVFPVVVPPLRERDDDVVLLAGFFLDAARARLGLGPVRLTVAARQALRRSDWPGNVRELEHVMLRATLRASGGRTGEGVVVDAAHLALEGPAATAVAVPVAMDEARTLRQAVDDYTRSLLLGALAAAGGNRAEAARKLGLDRSNFLRLAQRLEVALPPAA